MKDKNENPKRKTEIKKELSEQEAKERINLYQKLDPSETPTFVLQKKEKEMNQHLEKIDKDHLQQQMNHIPNKGYQSAQKDYDNMKKNTYTKRQEVINRTVEESKEYYRANGSLTKTFNEKSKNKDMDKE